MRPSGAFILTPLTGIRSQTILLPQIAFPVYSCVLEATVTAFSTTISIIPIMRIFATKKIPGTQRETQVQTLLGGPILGVISGQLLQGRVFPRQHRMWMETAFRMLNMLVRTLPTICPLYSHPVRSSLYFLWQTSQPIPHRDMPLSPSSLQTPLNMQPDGAGISKGTGK